METVEGEEYDEWMDGLCCRGRQLLLLFTRSLKDDSTLYILCVPACRTGWLGCCRNIGSAGICPLVAVLEDSVETTDAGGAGQYDAAVPCCC